MRGNTAVREDQQGIASWLTNRAPELGEVYKGAVRLIADPSFPGRGNLVCHAARDICNRLPEVVGVLVFVENQHSQLNLLSDLWFRHKLDRLELEQISPKDPGVAESRSREVAIPLDILKQMGLVVGHHRQIPEMNRERAAKMFEVVAPEAIGRKEITVPQINQWMELKRWFQEHAHAGLTERAVDQTELEGKFEMLEAYLKKISGEEEFYEGVEALDEILEDANS